MIIDHIYLPVSDLKRSSDGSKKMLGRRAMTYPTSSGSTAWFRNQYQASVSGRRMAKSAETFTSHSPPRSADAVRASTSKVSDETRELLQQEAEHWTDMAC